MLYGKPHLNITYWGYAIKDFILHCNFNGSIHNTGISPFELWYGEKPDLIKYPMLPFGSIVMAHIPISQQTAGSLRSDVTYCVGTSIALKKDLILYNFNKSSEFIKLGQVVRTAQNLLTPDCAGYQDGFTSWVTQWVAAGVSA